MPNDAQTADESAASIAEHVADSGGTVVQLQPQAAAPHTSAPEADDRPTVCPLKVGQHDERGNTVEYIYAHLRQQPISAGCIGRNAPTMPPGYRYDSVPQRDGWWPFRGRGAGSAAEPTDPWKGVQAQLSNDQARRRTQRRNLLGLGVERAKLQALLSDWPRRRGYDDIDRHRAAARAGAGAMGPRPIPRLQALETLSDARASLVEQEREADLRAQCMSVSRIAPRCSRLPVLVGTASGSAPDIAPRPENPQLRVGRLRGRIDRRDPVDRHRARPTHRRPRYRHQAQPGSDYSMLVIFYYRRSVGRVPSYCLFASGLLPRLTGSQGAMDHESIAFAAC